MEGSNVQQSGALSDDCLTLLYQCQDESSDTITPTALSNPQKAAELEKLSKIDDLDDIYVFIKNHELGIFEPVDKYTQNLEDVKFFTGEKAHKMIRDFVAKKYGSPEDFSPKSSV